MNHESLCQVILLALVCCFGFARESKAAMCPNEDWRYTTGVFALPSGTTSVLIRGTAEILHDSAHTSSCIGTIYMILTLNEPHPSYSCTTGEMSFPVTYATSHQMEREKDCAALPRGFTYPGQMEYWWSNDDHDFVESGGVYITKDDDNDGHDEYSDCDETRNDVWDDGTDQDTDQWYAFEDCNDQNENVQEEIECDIWECEVDQGLHWGPPCYTPILLATDPLASLTPADRGVPFDIGAIGRPHFVAWTRPETDAGWLALDRNANHARRG